MPPGRARSRLRRLVSNVEILGHDAGQVRVACNAMIFESRAGGDTVWASRNEYTLRRIDDGELRMALKKVVLVNNETALYSMAFLI